ALEPERDMLVSDSGRIWFDRDFLLQWPGLKPQRAFMDMPDELLCFGGLNDNKWGFSNAILDLKMGKSEAKELKDKLPRRIMFQVAALLDGNVGEEPLACRSGVPRTPTGKVLAWRLGGFWEPETVLVPWTTVASFEPPESCEELRGVFGFESIPAIPASASAQSAVAPGGSAPTNP
ncbi:MAG: hypothetical protein FWD57_12685, partial [Polyangiaceae bacterium]|nr:hypothetical protein [Polyangiaceae bacterium]